MLTTVAVSGQLYNPDGSPAANAAIRFTLSGLGVAGLDLIVPRFADTTCDALGAFVLQVAPSPPGTYYAVRAGRDGVLLFTTRAVVPGNNCQFSQIMQALPAPAIDASQQALIDLQAAQAGIETSRQSSLSNAASAAASADAATAQAASFATSLAQVATNLVATQATLAQFIATH